MRLLTLGLTLGSLLGMVHPARSQSVEIQKQLQRALEQARFEKARADTAQAQVEKAQKAQQDMQDKMKATKADQPKGPSLEDMVTEALKNNPDIRVAESKLREAEAELNRVRLQVTQKVVAQQREIALYKTHMMAAEEQFQRAHALSNSGALSREELTAAESNLQKAKANLARLEADLPFLLGNGGPRGVEDLLILRLKKDQISKEQQTIPMVPLNGPVFRLQVQDKLPEYTSRKIRDVLTTEIKVDFDQIAPRELLDFLKDRVKGFNLIAQVDLDKAKPASLQLREPIPLGAVFQFLEDNYHWRFIVREYGIVITEPGRVPPGAMDLQDLWTNRPAPTTAEKK